MRNGSLLLLFGILLFPFAVSANGGIKEVAEGKYMVNLSAAPIAPYVGEKQSMLLGFADIYGNLVEKDISVDLSLHYEQRPVFSQKNLLAKNGVLSFDYTYEQPGIYELFVAFQLPDEPDHTYMPEDFLIEVKERTDGTLPLVITFAISLFTFVLGIGLGKYFTPFPLSP